MTKKIAIFGDSWGCSSFVKLPNFQEKLSDLTFQKLFPSDRYTVSNHSIRGGTNLEIINAVNTHHKDNDLLIIFQTDPIRQYFVDYLSQEGWKINESIPLPDATNFEEFCELTLKDFYDKLAEVDTPILLIGGSSKLCHKYVPSKIKTFPKSWTEFIVPEFTDSYCYWIEPSLAVYNYARKKLKWNSTLADFSKFEDEIKQKNYTWQTHDAFAWCHAADPAYHKMFDKIMEVLENDYS